LHAPRRGLLDEADSSASGDESFHPGRVRRQADGEHQEFEGKADVKCPSGDTARLEQELARYKVMLQQMITTSEASKSGQEKRDARSPRPTSNGVRSPRGRRRSSHIRVSMQELLEENEMLVSQLTEAQDLVHSLQEGWEKERAKCSNLERRHSSDDDMDIAGRGQGRPLASSQRACNSQLRQVQDEHREELALKDAALSMAQQAASRAREQLQACREQGAQANKEVFELHKELLGCMQHVNRQDQIIKQLKAVVREKVAIQQSGVISEMAASTRACSEIDTESEFGMSVCGSTMSTRFTKSSLASQLEDSDGSSSSGPSSPASPASNRRRATKNMKSELMALQSQYAELKARHDQEVAALANERARHEEQMGLVQAKHEDELKAISGHCVSLKKQLVLAAEAQQDSQPATPRQPESESGPTPRVFPEDPKERVVQAAVDAAMNADIGAWEEIRPEDRMEALRIVKTAEIEATARAKRAGVVPKLVARIIELQNEVAEAKKQAESEPKETDPKAKDVWQWVSSWM